jgi:hypothetical protein
LAFLGLIDDWGILSVHQSENEMDIQEEEPTNGAPHTDALAKPIARQPAPHHLVEEGHKLIEALLVLDLLRRRNHFCRDDLGLS